MRTISAAELKRRGVIALEELVDEGPVHVLRRNRPACVVLSEADYARLVGGTPGRERPDIWEILLAETTGERSREDLDRQIAEERDGWDSD